MSLSFKNSWILRDSRRSSVTRTSSLTSKSDPTTAESSGWPTG